MTVDASPAEETADLRPAHGLRWGIKASFIDYLSRMPDGRGAVGDGASAVGVNEVFFTLDGDPAARAEGIEWTFRGDARFTGHYGMLFVRLAHPRLEGTAEAAVLTIVDPDSDDPGSRIPLVTLTLDLEQVHLGTEVWSGTNVALTEEGTYIFNEVYQVGEEFEPLVVQLPARQTSPPAEAENQEQQL